MTRVLVIVGATTSEALRKVQPVELAEADMVIALNEECSKATVIKDRFGRPQPVKVVS